MLSRLGFIGEKPYGKLERNVANMCEPIIDFVLLGQACMVLKTASR